MVLRGVDEIDWFTDRPDRVEGTWTPKRLLRKWDKYFASSEPNAQATVQSGEDREILTFEIFKPKKKNGQITFKMNLLSDLGEEKIIGLVDKAISNISLFIDDAKTPLPAKIKEQKCQPDDATKPPSWNPKWPDCLPDCSDALLKGADLRYLEKGKYQFTRANLTNADLTGSSLEFSDLSDAILVDANFSETILNDVDFQRSDLSRADFSDSFISLVNFSGSNLKGAILNGEWLAAVCPNGESNPHGQPCSEDTFILDQFVSP